MDNILAEFKKANSFFDNYMLYSKRVEYLDLLQKVLQKFANYGIYINYKTCEFMVTECNFVGHVVNIVKPQPSRISDVVNFNRPNNVAVLRTFLRMAAYCRKFTAYFSNRAACLYDLFKKGKRFVWSEVCESSFVYLKEKLQRISLLIHPDF